MESGEEHADDLEDEAFTAIANELLEKCNLPGKVTRIEECSDNFFVGVYKGLLGDDLPGIVDNPVTTSQCIGNCQTVIDTVATEVLCVDLSHISGRSIVEHDRVSIRNLLEIFAGLLEFFMECVDGQADAKDSDEDDSNLLTSEHDIISGVLREELGPSYQELIGPRPSNLSESPQRGVYDSHQQRSVQQSVQLAPQGPAEKNQAMKLKIDIGNQNGNSTGFEADTSKLTDSTTDVVSDSTAELIRLGGSGSVRPSKAIDTKGPNFLVPESLSHSSISLDSVAMGSYDPHRRGASSGVKDGTRSKDAHLSVPFYDEDVAKKQGVRVSEADSSQASGVARRRLECPSAEDDLTQYSLTSGDIRQVNDKDVQKDPSKPSSSFLSASTASASWPDQISPLEPTTISAGGGSREFETLGERPKEQPASAEGSEDGTGGSSGRSTPVYHHYHHHFHHTQPQLGVPGFQPVAGVSAAATVGVPGTTASSSRHGPPAAIAGPLGTGPIGNDRFVHTAPAAVTLPHTAASAPDKGMVSSGGLTYPPSTAGTRTQSSLTDSVFLSASGSGRPPLAGMAIASMPSDTVSGTGSLRERLTRPLPTTVTSADPSLPLSRTVPSASYPRRLPLGSSLDGRVQGNIPPDRWAHSVDTLPTRQRLASTFPERPLQSERLKPRITDINPPTVRRNEVAELLAKYKKSEAGNSDISDDESESDREDEDEVLAQNSDSAVDYGRSCTARSKTLTARTKKRIEENENTRTRRGYRADSTAEGTSPERPPRRGVTFRDTVETFPVSGRMDRLRRLLYEEAEEERKQHTQALRKGYRNQLKEIHQSKEMKRDRHSKRKIPLSPNVPKKKPRKKTTLKQRGRPEKVYCSQDRRSRSTKQSTTKVRKRSASASPVLRRNRRMSDSDHPEALLPAMLEEFPFLHVSPQTAHSMWQKQTQHLSSILKSGSATKKTKTQRMIEDAEWRQQTLVGILKKDLEHNIRMREKQDRQQQQQTVRAKLREKRQISARARRYYDEYELRMRARMLKRRTREEQIFKRLFQDGLDLQKQRIRELREYAKEKRESLAQRQQNEIESLENFYRDQFAMLSEGIAREKYEMEVREKAQEKVVRQMRRELRQKLEHDVKEFQDNLQRDEDSAYFRQLEADRLRREFQLSTRNTFY